MNTYVVIQHGVRVKVKGDTYRWHTNTDLQIKKGNEVVFDVTGEFMFFQGSVEVLDPPATL